MDKGDSTDFEVIERSSSDTLVNMWVFFEDASEPVKVTSDITKTKDLNDLKFILQKEFEELKNAYAKNITFLNRDMTALLPNAELQTLAKSKTVEDPLIVRYHLSNLLIQVTFKFTANKGTSKADCGVKHTSNLFDVLQNIAKNRFADKLKDIPEKNIYFEYGKKTIENNFQIINLVNNMDSCKNQVDIDYLKVQIKDLKSYSDWKIDQVLLDIYDRTTGNPDLELGKFDIENFGRKPHLQLSDEELKDMVKDLTKKKRVFDTVNNNEATAREYISVILIYAVDFILKNLDDSVLLKVEENLAGTHGYGPLDYAILLKSIYILITEAKSNQTVQKGIAQNLAQIHSASELYSKRKVGQTGEVPMFGIVTNGRTWVFIRRTGPMFPIKYADIDKSKEFTCTFEGDMETEKKVVGYVVRLIRAQYEELEALDQRNPKRSKR